MRAEDYHKVHHLLTAMACEAGDTRKPALRKELDAALAHLEKAWELTLPAAAGEPLNAGFRSLISRFLSAASAVRAVFYTCKMKKPGRVWGNPPGLEGAGL